MGILLLGQLSGWRPLRLGAGGLITGIDVAPDGTAVCRCDTFGAYIYSGGKWQQLCTSGRLPGGSTGPGTNSGVYEIRIAPSNSSVIYMTYGQENASGDPAVFVSNNKGASFVQTSFIKGMSANTGAKRKYGPHGAIDPANADVFYITTDASGAWLTTNGTTGVSSTWSQVSGIANNDAGNCGVVAFDASGGTTGGKTNNIYIGVSGTGLYRSTNAGSSFSLVANMPAGISVKRIKIASDGTVYLVTYTGTVPDANGTLYKLTFPSGTATWTNITPSGLAGIAESFILDPNNVNHITVQAYAVGFYDSANAGSSWTAGTSWTSTSTSTLTLAAGAGSLTIGTGLTISAGQGVIVQDQAASGGGPFSWGIGTVTSYNSGTGVLNFSITNIGGTVGSYSTWAVKHRGYVWTNTDAPYLTTLGPVAGSNIAVGFVDMIADPSSSNIYAVGGQDMIQLTYPVKTDGTWLANDISLGIEQLASRRIIVPPGQLPICCSEDIGILRSPAPDTSPSVESRPSGGYNFLNTCWGADWATSNSSFITAVYAVQEGEDYVATSSDGGITWAFVPTHVANLFGGSIACATSTNFIIQPSDDGLPQYTKDGGTTWTQLATLGGQTPNGGWGHNAFSPGCHIAADRAAAGTFYMENDGTGSGGGQGSYKSTDGGATWTYNSNSLQTGGYTWIKTPPQISGGANVAGHIFRWSYGFSGGNWSGPTTTYTLQRSTDGGATWTAVLPATSGFPAIAEVWALGFGAPAPGHTHPAIIGYLFYNDGTGWVQGMYRSIDNAATWQKLSGQYPDGWTDWIIDVAGDPSTYGTYYFVKSGSSYAVAQGLT